MSVDEHWRWRAEAAEKSNAELRGTVDRLQQELLDLRRAERDPIKLRNRLEVRAIELANANDRIRELVAELRRASPKAPMLEWHRNPSRVREGGG